MPNSYFQFKQFLIRQDHNAMKVTTDGCLFGAWVANKIKYEKIRNGLDIGTGTGLLSLMILQKNPVINFDAIEIDEKAASEATLNVNESPWAENINVINSDIRNFNNQHKYDLIISNPPFYENELKSGKSKKNQAHHSSDLTITELLTAIKNNIQADGSFYLLLPYKRNEEIKKLLFDQQLMIEEIVFVNQTPNHEFFRFMINGKLKSDDTIETEIDEITICDEKKVYTKEFKNLLSDYYLYL